MYYVKEGLSYLMNEFAEHYLYLWQLLLGYKRSNNAEGS